MNAKLSVWTAYYVALSPEDAVLELKKNGILCAELSDEHGLMLLQRGEPAETGAQFREFLKKESFTMTQGHLWLSVQLCTDPEAVPKLVRWLELYDAIGIQNAVLHCDSMPESRLDEDAVYARNLDMLRQLCEQTAHLQIRICLENLMRICQDVNHLVWLVDQLPEDRFGICLDTGHLHLTDGDQRNFILKAGHRLHALHIADNEGERDQHLMPFGRGKVDFFEVVKALREVDYNGLFNLEIPGERHAPMSVLGYKLEYIRKCYDYLMGCEGDC